MKQETTVLCYGHLFYRYSMKERVQLINDLLREGVYHSLEEFASDNFLDAEEIKAELLPWEYVFIAELNQFVAINRGIAN